MIRRIIYIGMLAGMLASACQENEMNGFEKDGAVYFQLNTQLWSDVTDSMAYSFVGKAKMEDTIELQVNLMGEAVDYDRKFEVVVDTRYTTAEEGVHFAALESAYILPAHAFNVQVPVVLYGTDSRLEERSFQLAIKLGATEDLQLGLTKRTSARIIISNRMTKPTYWEQAYMDNYFGQYSKVKHECCIEQLGMDFPATYNDFRKDWALWQANGKYMDNYFYENSIYDENGILIEPWL